MQLQLYEAEVRNHIRVQQQLKLHIEVLNEKVEEFEKEREELKQKMAKEFKEKEEKMKEKFQTIVDQKMADVARITAELTISKAQLN